MEAMKKALVVLALCAIALPVLAQTATPSYAVYPNQSYCPQLSRYLYRGLSDRSTAGQVSALQYYLGTYFAAEPVPMTGYYGPITTNFVARFQQQQGVYPVTGGVGPLTRAAIARLCGGVVPPQPVSGFSATPTQGTAPLDVAFSINTVTGNDINALSIDFGDGQTGKPQTIYCFAAPCNPAMTASHTYSTTGTYTARLLLDNNYCAQGMYCTLMYREPTVVGTVVVTVSGGTQQTVSANPSSGYAPLLVTFNPGTTGYFAVDFGDGSNASMLQGSVQHVYYARGTYTAQFTSDMACMHTNPRCMVATMLIGSATVTVY